MSSPVSVAFVLVSWAVDAPAGMERAVAGAAAGLVAAGHRAVIVTAADAGVGGYRGATVVRLGSLDVSFPCTDDELRQAASGTEPAIAAELSDLYARHRVDVVVYVDALWGLGMIMPTGVPVRRILAVHVVGHDIDLRAALERVPHVVFAPSPVVIDTAARRGFVTDGWRVLPNGLLDDPRPASDACRAWLRISGAIRVLARAGAEKGVDRLLADAGSVDQPVEVALAVAAFEAGTGAQDRTLALCRRYADGSPLVTVRPGLAWAEVPGWLAGAAVVIVPSLRETFGLVALEAMAGGTPVVTHDVGNLPALLGHGGVVVPTAAGPARLWRAARDLLGDPVRYEATSRAAYYRSRDYRPALIADQLLKVVS